MKHLLSIQPAVEVEHICNTLRHQLTKDLRRRGVVLGLSGGIDSSVTAALAVQALGRDRVFGILMPERDSSPDTLHLSRLVADSLGIARAEEDITSLLEAAGFYRRYEETVRNMIPEFGVGWKSKLITSGVREGGTLTFFTLVAQAPDGSMTSVRLPVQTYLEIVAATNFKQRMRKMLEYYHADRLNFAVAGTPNRLEYDQGFFVKNGDGSADIKPIAHLYKCQVYQLAEYLGLPEVIRKRPPTTDTYSMPQGQDEFFFALPVAQLDFCLYAKNHGIPASEVASATGLNEPTIQAVWKDIDRKRATTRPLHLPPLLVRPVPEIH
jgi:NAD+ synthase